MATFINKEVMEKSCRLCMARFAKYNVLGFKSRNLAEEIKYCTGIIISQSDTLSTKICTKCLKNLTVAHKFKKLCLETDSLLRQPQTVVNTDCQKSEPNFYPVIQKSESDLNTADSQLRQAVTVKLIDSPKIKTDIHADRYKLENEIEIKQEYIPECNDVEKLPNDDIKMINEVEKLPNDDERLPNDGIKMTNHDIKMSNDDPDDGIKLESNQNDSRTLVIEYLDKGVLKINDDDKLMIEKLENEMTDDVTNDHLDDKDPEWKCDEEEESEEDTKKLPIKKNGRFWQFKCARCNIHFNLYTSYVKHNVKVHSERETYVCEVCGHNTKSYYAYSRHRKLHKAPKYHCDSCDYKSCYKNNLILHVATHSDARRYQCDQCGDTFRTTRGRYNHVRIVHQNKKRTRCEKCDKVFTDKYKLRRHMDTHFNIKRHECEVCLVKYTDRANLKKHMLTAHNVAIPRLQRQFASYDPNYQ